VLPELAAARREGRPVGPWTPNAALAAALEVGRAEGKPEIPVQSKWPQTRDAPLQEVTAGGLHYVWKEPTPESAYEKLKEAGSKEFTIGIGSHGNFLGMYCLEAASHPNNLAVLQKLMVVRVKSEGCKQSFEVAEVAGKCRVILESPAAPKPGSLSKSDLGDACMSDAAIDVSLFVDTQPEPAAGKLTPCRAKAEEFRLAEDAEAAVEPQAKFASGMTLWLAGSSSAAIGWYVLLTMAVFLGGASMLSRGRIRLACYELVPPALTEPFRSSPSQVATASSAE